MSKENISATVDPEIAQWLDQPGRNKSETINQALKQYRQAGGNERAMIELRLEQIKSRKNELKSQLSSVEDEEEQLERRLDNIVEEQEKEKEDVFNQALEMLSFEELNSVNDVWISSSESAIQDFAEDVDMELETFTDELIERYKQQ